MDSTFVMELHQDEGVPRAHGRQQDRPPTVLRHPQPHGARPQLRLVPARPLPPQPDRLQRGDVEFQRQLHPSRLREIEPHAHAVRGPPRLERDARRPQPQIAVVDECAPLRARQHRADDRKVGPRAGSEVPGGQRDQQASGHRAGEEGRRPTRGPDVPGTRRLGSPTSPYAPGPDARAAAIDAITPSLKSAGASSSRTWSSARAHRLQLPPPCADLRALCEAVPQPLRFLRGVTRSSSSSCSSRSSWSSIMWALTPRRRRIPPRSCRPV